MDAALAISPSSVAEETSLTLGNPAEMTNDQLADVVIEGVKKIRAYLPHIRTLKERFDAGERDSANRLKIPIKGCCSWAEFCDKHLDRTPRAVRDALKPIRPAPAPVSVPETPEPANREVLTPADIVQQVTEIMDGMQMSMQDTETALLTVRAYIDARLESIKGAA